MLRHNLHWRVKLSIKILLSYFKIPYHIFKKISIFAHGDMENPEHSTLVILNHLKALGLHKESLKDKTVLEIGPGDSLATGLICGALGAKKTILVDAGNFASQQVEVYRDLLAYLKKNRIIAENYTFNSMDEMCKLFKIIYLTEGGDSLLEVDDGSVDFVFSHVCLEHVLKNEMNSLIKNLYKKTKAKSRQSHIIDFKDHLSKSLNNMRFSDDFWESNVAQKSSAYTNRLRLVDYLKYFNENNFHVSIVKEHNWKKLPINYELIHSSYNYTYSQLLTQEAEIVVTKYQQKKGDGGC